MDPTLDPLICGSKFPNLYGSKSFQITTLIQIIPDLLCGSIFQTFNRDPNHSRITMWIQLFSKFYGDLNHSRINYMDPILFKITTWIQILPESTIWIQLLTKLLRGSKSFQN
ncbi:hypothetical protein CEXT_280141 [Caerostris extrusa]|uniref:Uncharacterized protein n=1 Tax=Caerostris extrusa TaxID=172846 RepID=A0AAV4XQ48_CAEEX|nr:hypothetical protein CEXT_280141 [Caerostris extrusa]